MTFKKRVIKAIILNTLTVMVLTSKIEKRNFIIECVENSQGDDPPRDNIDYSPNVVYAAPFEFIPEQPYQRPLIQPIIYYIFYYLPYRYEASRSQEWPILSSPHVSTGEFNNSDSDLSIESNSTYNVSSTTDSFNSSSVANSYKAPSTTGGYSSTVSSDEYKIPNTTKIYTSTAQKSYQPADTTVFYTSTLPTTLYKSSTTPEPNPLPSEENKYTSLSTVESYSTETSTSVAYDSSSTIESNLIFTTLEPNPLSSEENKYTSLSTAESYSTETSTSVAYDSSSTIESNLIFTTIEPSTTKEPKNNCDEYKGPKCDESARYRTIDGSCNNLKIPLKGMANTKYTRLRPANYLDHIHEPPKAKSGKELPNVRQISFTLFPHAEVPDPLWNVLAMQWGQFMSHDMSKLDMSESNKAKCCSDQRQFIKNLSSSSSNLTNASTSLCFPIRIPENDPIYTPEKQQCHHFARSTTDFDKGCSAVDRPSAQLNTESAFLDLSMIYGSSENVMNNMRSDKGRLKTVLLNNRVWLPPTTNKNLCTAFRKDKSCYASGDNRANMNPQLAVMHLIFVREHNRIADKLRMLNLNWDDEKIFQETRRILIAMNQHISYYEWLPIFLGKQNLFNQKIIFNVSGWVDDYNPNEDAGVINEYANAAFRFFHTLIPGKILLLNESWLETSPPLRLSDHYKNPAIIEKNSNLDDISRGMAFQAEESSDAFFDRETSMFLFRGNRELGEDLRSIDIQRGRDHGLASYNDFREFAGLRRAKTWHDFRDLIGEESIEILKKLYESPDDVDLTVGGSLEKHAQGALVGPTFLKIMIEQFRRTRAGDRYWYETDKPGIRFTEAQLKEIRKSSVSRLFCDNGDAIKSIQQRGFEKISKSNPRVNCSQIPAVNLSLWKE